jgi:hypothetical protein
MSAEPAEGSQFLDRPNAPELSEAMALEVIDAALSGKVSFLRSLLFRNALDARTCDRALCAAAASGRIHVVNLLIHYGADPCYYRQSALHRAVSGGHVAITRILLRHGAVSDISITTCASMHHQYRMLAILLPLSSPTDGQTEFLLKAVGTFRPEARRCLVLILRWASDSFLKRVRINWEFNEWIEVGPNIVPALAEIEMVLRRVT